MRSQYIEHYSVFPCIEQYVEIHCIPQNRLLNIFRNLAIHSALQCISLYFAIHWNTLYSSKWIAQFISALRNTMRSQYIEHYSVFPCIQQYIEIHCIPQNIFLNVEYIAQCISTPRNTMRSQYIEPYSVFFCILQYIEVHCIPQNRSLNVFRLLAIQWHRNTLSITVYFHVLSNTLKYTVFLRMDCSMYFFSSQYNEIALLWAIQRNSMYIAIHWKISYCSKHIALCISTPRNTIRNCE